jgi:hypothetical protein
MLLRPRGIVRRRSIVRMAALGGKRGRPTGAQITEPEPIAAPRQSTAPPSPPRQGADRRP